MIHVGDCLDVLRTLADNSVDAIVTDPPYGLAFMGKRWDYDVPSVEVWAECLRVLKPGGHLLAFAGTRTQHRMAVRIEDAGFEIRDLIAWVYGSGFPKSHNGEWGGTALKPALEPITVARKPLQGTVAANVLAHGTGALNIDGCRIETPENLNGGTYSGAAAKETSEGWRMANARREFVQPAGRWPANLIHDGSDEVLAGFPAQAGAASPVRGTEASAVTAHAYGERDRVPGAFHGYAGSAARFFYCAKASKADRDEGLESVDAKACGLRDAGRFNSGGRTLVDGEWVETGSDPQPKRNVHPTVKPTDLMRYLCRLVTPPGGLVLDPFAGSGSTGKGAILEGFRFLGIERDPEYAAIAQARIDHAHAQRLEDEAERAAATAQADLFGELIA